jgi:hypothetical protein
LADNNARALENGARLLRRCLPQLFNAPQPPAAEERLGRDCERSIESPVFA